MLSFPPAAFIVHLRLACVQFCGQWSLTNNEDFLSRPGRRLVSRMLIVFRALWLHYLQFVTYALPS